MTVDNEYIKFIAQAVGIFATVWKMISARNEKLMTKIDEKLDKVVYEKDKANFEKWSDERDRNLEQKVDKLERDISKSLDEIKGGLASINEHMMNCKK